jgi:hypothetical protein
VLDLSFLAPLGTFLGVLGGGAVWLFNRADKQRTERETSVIGLLKTQNESLKAEARSRFRDGAKWRDQLLLAGLTPDPEEWTDWEQKA